MNDDTAIAMGERLERIAVALEPPQGPSMGEGMTAEDLIDLLAPPAMTAFSLALTIGGDPHYDIVNLTIAGALGIFYWPAWRWLTKGIS